MNATLRTFLFSFPLLLIALAAPLWAQGTFTAASCNQSDVKAVISGPTHTAVNGDTIIIPAGTCTWTTGLSISKGITLTGSGTPNTTPSTFGAGSLNTTLIDNVSGNNPLVSVTGITTGQTFRLSTLDIEPNSASTPLGSPIHASGVCNSAGCAQIRIDNIGFGLNTQWNENGNSSNADWMIRTDNVFGVLDHNTLPNGSSVELFNSNHSAYLGVGGYGDNSWAQPDTFGTGNTLFAENNIVYINQAMSDCDVAPAGGGVGGCRVAGRYNHVTFEQYGFALMIPHGLDTDGRPQGGRQLEAYGNTISCPVPTGCNTALVGFRSGTGFVFNNTMSTSNGGFYNNLVSITVYRNVFTAGGGWGACGGSSPYDTNDGVVYYSGTNSGSGGSTILTDSAQHWTTNQFIPAGAPYSVYNVTQGWWAEIASNTANTLTIQGSIPEQTNLFNNGDRYQILRATVCVNQAGRGQGSYVSGATPSPASPLSQVLDPIYEWGDSVPKVNYSYVTASTGRTIANRDWYTDNGAGAQTSTSSPFNGTSGVGRGTLANRPTTCTKGVGYWATDQGSWNQSGIGGQGQLFVCSATNTWTLHYTPYTYPHPLTQGVGQGGGTGGTLPAPPTNVTAILQ